MASAGAQVLWDMLYDPKPREVAGPEVGVIQDAIEVAKRGRGHGELAIEVSTAPAYGHWMPHVRRRTRRGGIVEELYARITM